MSRVFELTNNKKTIRKYEIYDTYECGMVLNSFLLRKILRNELSLTSVHGWIKNNEIFLRNFGVKDATNNVVDWVKLLLKKEEIKKIIRLTNEKKLSLIPTKLFLKNHKVKVELSLAKYNRNIKNQEKLNKLKEQSWKKLNLKEIE